MCEYWQIVILYDILSQAANPSSVFPQDFNPGVSYLIWSSEILQEGFHTSHDASKLVILLVTSSSSNWTTTAQKSQFQIYPRIYIYVQCFGFRKLLSAPGSAEII